MRILLVVAAVALAGCGPSRQELMMAAGDDCRAYGFVPGSPEYSNCMMTKDSQYQAADFQRRQAVAAGLRQMGAQIAAPPPRGVTCTSRRVFNEVVTDCQ